MSNSADQLLDADLATRLILELIPETERARVAAIAEGEPTLVSVGLGQLLTGWLGQYGGHDTTMQETVRRDADEDVDAVVQAYWRWLREWVLTVH
jgi:hypothetical protein